MADLRTFSTAEEASEHILTKGPSGEIQDGHGVDITEILLHGVTGKHLTILPDSFIQIGDIRRSMMLFYGKGGHAYSSNYALVFISDSAIHTTSVVGSTVEFALDVPDGTTGNPNTLTLFLDITSGNCYFENRLSNQVQIAYLTFQ